MRFPKPHKYKAKKTEFYGYSFDSQLEAALYGHLKLLAAADEIRNIQIKPNVRLTQADILMIPDFKAFDRRRLCEVYYEAKGFETPEWRLKRRLWTVYGPGPLQVFKGTYRKIFIAEEIIPRCREETCDAETSHV